MGRRSKLLFAAALALLLAMGFLVRVAPYRSVFTPGHVNLVAADSHYYVRLAKLQLQAFPELVTHDPLLGKDGGRVFWPLGHTLLVAAVGGLLGGDPEAAAAWVGPLLSLLLLVLVALAAKGLLGTSAALIVTLLLALTPTVVTAGLIGEADHHVHEAFLSCGVALLLASGIARPSLQKAVVLGLLLAGGRLLTTSAFAMAVPVFAALAGAILLERERARVLGRFALTLALSAAALATVHAVLMGALDSLEYELASAFHPRLFLASGALCVALAGLVRGNLRAALPASLIAALSAAPLVASATRALQHLGREDPLLAVVMESRPLLGDLPLALGHLGPLLFLAPAAIVWSIHALWRRGETPWLSSAIMTLLFGVAAALQVRFAPLFAGAVAVLLGSLGARLMASLPRPGQRAGLATALSLSLIAWHIGPIVPIQPQYGPLRPTLTWLGEALAEVEDPAGKVVLANPFLGHFLMLWSEAAVVASPFSQLPEHSQAFSQARAFFAAPEEASASALAWAVGATWVLATPGAFSKEASGLSGAATWLLPIPCGAQRCLSAERFRLVRAAEPSEAGFIYLFEHVRGARYTGVATPGTSVKVSRVVETDTGPLRWHSQQQADEEGHFEFRLPYPTHATDEVRPYRVELDGRPLGEIFVTLEEVRSGSVVALEPAAARTGRGGERVAPGPTKREPRE